MCIGSKPVSIFLAIPENNDTINATRRLRNDPLIKSVKFTFYFIFELEHPTNILISILSPLSLFFRLLLLSVCVFFPQTNDFVRDVFRDKDGFISLPFEIVAGGCVSKQFFFSVKNWDSIWLCCNSLNGRGRSGVRREGFDVLWSLYHFRWQKRTEDIIKVKFYSKICYTL